MDPAPDAAIIAASIDTPGTFGAVEWPAVTAALAARPEAERFADIRACGGLEPGP